MKTFSIGCILLCSLSLSTGCSLLKNVQKDSEGASSTSVVASPTTVAQWLEQAPNPVTIACSLTPSEAPDAVATFESISGKVASLYKEVHTYAQELKADPNALPSVESSLISEEMKAELAKDPTAWRKALQDEFTAHYQNIVKEVAAQKKAITTFTTNLPNDETIAGISNPIQKTQTLFKLASDVKGLEEQLQATGEGALLILHERMKRVTGK